MQVVFQVPNFIKRYRQATGFLTICAQISAPTACIFFIVLRSGGCRTDRNFNDSFNFAMRLKYFSLKIISSLLQGSRLLSGYILQIFLPKSIRLERD